VIDNGARSIVGGDPSYFEHGVPRRDIGGQIWAANWKTGETRNLTGTTGSNWMPVWSPDSRYLAFLSDRDGQARVWLWNGENGQIERASDEIFRAGPMSRGLEWMPDSRHLLMTTEPKGIAVNDSTSAAASGGTEGGKEVSQTTVVLYGSDPHHQKSIPAYDLDEYLADLILIDVRGGPSRTIAAGKRIGWFALSPDGSRVGYAVPLRFESKGSFEKIYDLRVDDLASGAEENLAQGVPLDDIFNWSPDGAYLTYGTYAPTGSGYSFSVMDVAKQRVLYSVALPHGMICCRLQVPFWESDGAYFYFVADGTLWRVAMATGKSEEFAHIPGHTIEYRIADADGFLWVPSGQHFTVVVAHDNKGKGDGFYQIDLGTGKSRVLRERGECYTCKTRITDSNAWLMAVSGDKKHFAFIAEDASHPPDLWVSDGSFTSVRQVTHLNPQLERYKMGVPRLLAWRSDEGTLLHGAVLLPPGYREGIRYPLIVWVYPAMYSNWIDQFGFGEFPGPFNMQIFATRGYVVLLPDVEERPGEPLLSLGSSVLPGISKLIEMGVVTPARIAVMGHSAGGYSALALLAQATVFRTGVVVAGFGDYAADYGELEDDGAASHYGAAERQLGGAPWQVPLAYVQNSPVYRLNRIRVPVLLAIGSEDESVHPELLDEVFVGMQRLGHETVYAKYVGESHVPRDWSYPNQTDLCRRLLDWLDRYMK
jgi:dipeptidyl aminopeptidase/acylaminoacyl peptidase